MEHPKINLRPGVVYLLGAPLDAAGDWNEIIAAALIADSNEFLMDSEPFTQRMGGDTPAEDRATFAAALPDAHRNRRYVISNVTWSGGVLWPKKRLPMQKGVS